MVVTYFSYCTKGDIAPSVIEQGAYSPARQRFLKQT